MEGVPRIPMMGFPMRRSADTPSFRAKLRSFISNHYNEDPDSYNNEIHELESLRASAVHVSKDYSGCSTLKKYFCQLNFLKSRFPLNEGGSCAVSFSWYDVFSEQVHGWSDIDFEMSCILYNIGALHSELGALDNRQTADGMKTSCTHFQCAAWAFNHLRHNYQKFFTPDVSPDMLNILYNICLAQAQECILEKSLIDNRKSTITAKVALQIVEYYSTALRIIDTMSKDAAQYSDKLIKSVKQWRKLVELKVHYYGCIAYLYRGMQAEDQGKWGERVTMYKAAVEKLNTCIKFGKNLEKTDPVHDTINFTVDVVGGKVAIAEKENEFIYHEKVPELEAVMSDVKGVSLVKGIQFKFDDPQVAGADIFGRLVPMEAHEASSLYSEEKAKILRTYSKKIEEKNEALDRFVLPLQLDQLDLRDTDKIPQELIDCCAALSVNQDAVKRLSELMANLSGLFHDVEANLEEIQDHLADQEKREKEYQEVVGKRPPNNIINEIHREFQKYQSAQSVAAESNKTLHEAMVAHVANLNILMKPLDEIMKHIPKYDEMEKNEEALERMKKLAGKVGEMRKQREMLETQLRDSILSDDITKSLVVKKDEDLETVFKEELQKHDKITQLLDQNLLAQENIVRALTEANAEYAETRRATVELKKKRDAVIQSLISSYEAYDELIAKCNKGIEFYTKLNTNVGKLLQRMRSVCKVQNEERDINMERIIRKAQAPIPGVPTSAMSGQYPGYHPPASMTASMPPASAPIPGYIPAGVPGSPAAMPPSRPSGGGHLKLKDYLAMKKEGQNPAALMQNNMPPAGADPNAQAMGMYPANNAYYGQQNFSPGNSANQVPSPSVTPQAGYYNQPSQQPQPQTNQNHSSVISQNPSAPPPPSPMPSAPQAPSNPQASPYGTQQLPQQMPQQQQQFNMPPSQSPADPRTSSPYANHQQQQNQQVPPQHGQMQQPPTNPQASYSPQQQQVQQVPPQSHVQPPPVNHQAYAPPQQHQQQQQVPHQGVAHPGVQPTAPVNHQPSYPSQQPQQQQPQQIPQQQRYPPPVPTPSSNRHTPYSIPSQQQHQHNIPQNSVPMSAYTPSQLGYNPMSANIYASPVYSSRHHPSGENAPMVMGNTFSSAYGVPLSSSGYSGYQQTPSATSAPTTAPPPQTQQTSAASYYSPVYHPTANTITNATFSTGTTATPSQVSAAPQQPQSLPGTLQPPSAPVQQQQQPSQMPPGQTHEVPPTSSNAAAPQSQPAPQQQQQQQPQSLPSNLDTYNPANSFLAQYVRQSQGYLSNTSATTPTSFPSSASYATSNVAANSNQQPPSQQPPANYQPAAATAYPPQQQQTPPTMSGYGQQNNQYAGYPQQQQPSAPQAQPSAGPASYQQQQQQQPSAPQAQPSAGPASYQQPQQQQQWPQQPSAPQPQQPVGPASYQQQQPYNNQQQAYQHQQPQQYAGTPQAQQPPQQQQGYYNNAGPPPQQQPAHQNNGYPHPQQPVAPNKAPGNSNVDLLSDIDFNVMPTVTPLAPVVNMTGTETPTGDNSAASSKPNALDNNQGPTAGSFDPLWT